MQKKYIVSLDQGTTSSRALLVDRNGQICAMAQEEFTQIFPHPGWVEHDPEEIYSTQIKVFRELLKKNDVDPGEIAAIGITNQRETAVVWDRHSGKPVYNAIVWQDKRTAAYCKELKNRGLENYIRDNTGLVIDSYFSGTKIHWILSQVEGAREKAEKGDLLFGTIDSWLLWNLTERKVHATDCTNASRTLLYNIKTLQWDKKLLEELEVPETMLPEVKASSDHFGEMLYEDYRIPITGIAGDQQAALFGQACIEKGDAKNTYGTGCFMLMNTGEKPQFSDHGLLTTIAWGLDGKTCYALEGSIFIAGAAIQWLRDKMEIIENAEESEKLAMSVKGDNPVVMVPAFSGLGAPYWDMYARGAVFGLTRDTDKAHIVRATLDSLAYRTKDILDAMQNDAGIKLKTLKVDGGAAANNYLMQFQSDILGVPVERPVDVESTALGAAFFAGIGSGFWSLADISEQKKVDRVFQPGIDNTQRENLYKKWKKAVARTANWLDD
ncbi:glycerol kinase GlpK [Robertkochia aurantiaca]|uniref:glycerol kinase GlpK n=1 Tax=Robertkochia aurantiaca TaxID=2873700 RepID=UPI001CCF471E|nr:glycerol kinase GlpK [Robertkochia sp. 3YJGBD-33]